MRTISAVNSAVSAARASTSARTRSRRLVISASYRRPRIAPRSRRGVRCCWPLAHRVGSARSRVHMNLHLALLVAYCVGIMAMGLIVGAPDEDQGRLLRGRPHSRPRPPLRDPRRRQHRRRLHRRRVRPGLSRRRQRVVVGGLRRAGLAGRGLPGRAAHPPHRRRARPAHRRRFPGVPLRPERARHRVVAAVGGHPRHPGRPDHRHGPRPQRGARAPQIRGLPPGRDRHDRLLHRGRAADLGLGQRGAARPRARASMRCSFRSRSRAPAAGRAWSPRRLPIRPTGASGRAEAPASSTWPCSLPPS